MTSRETKEKMKPRYKSAKLAAVFFLRRSKLRLDEFGVKLSRQSFPPRPCLRHPHASYSPANLSLSRVTRKESEPTSRHAHAATTFRVQKLCLWAEKIYRLRTDIHIADRYALSVWNLCARNVEERNSSCRIQFVESLFSEIKGVVEHDIRL